MPGRREGPGSRISARASRVQAQIFPLLADRPTLQRFCDEWFNASIPESVAVFRPAFPVVFCVALRYPEMGDELAWQTGVMSQSELYFLLPLDRYRVEAGRLQFVEHAVTTPYIFVDNARSAVVGRERFGFPKVDCRFRGPADEGIPFVGGPLRHLSVSTWQPGTAGRRLAPLLHVVHEPPRGASSERDGGPFPYLTPRGLVPHRADLFALLRALAGELQARTSPGPAHELEGQLRELREASRDGLCVNVYNVRQLAHPLDPRVLRYQDLVRLRMRLAGLQDLRLFGERFGPGDGLSVVVHRVAVQPIVDRLGLRVSSRHATRGPDAAPVDVIRVHVPVYAQVDVELLRAERLCWRFQETGWYDDRERQLTPHPGRWAPYNRTLGPSAAAFLEPQPDEPILDVSFLMLAARADTVRARLRALVPPEARCEVSPLEVDGLTALRLVVSRSRERPARSRGDLVWLDGNYLSLSVPVVLRRGDTVEHAHFLLQELTDNDFSLQANRELAASPSDSASFTTGTEDWLSPAAAHALLVRVDTLALARSAVEARVKSAPLLEIYRNDEAPTGEGDASEDPRMAALRAALWPVVQRIRTVVSIGSIPHPGRPEVAVEQRLVRARFEEEVIAARADVAARFFLCLHPSETYPLARDLGLTAVGPHEDPAAPNGAHASPGLTVPVVALCRAALRVHLTRMEVMWQRYTPSEPRA